MKFKENSVYWCDESSLYLSRIAIESGTLCIKAALTNVNRRSTSNLISNYKTTRDMVWRSAFISDEMWMTGSGNLECSTSVRKLSGVRWQQRVTQEVSLIAQKTAKLHITTYSQLRFQ